MRNYDRLPPADLVPTLITYDPISGKFRHPRTQKPRGNLLSDGRYVRVYLKGYGTYLAHNVAFAWMTGEWPPPDRQIDHIDRNGTNNQWQNLRLATLSQQRYNIGIPSNHRYGVRGVYFDPEQKTWRTQIDYEGVRMHKRTKTFEEAVTLRQQWVKEFHRW